MKKELTCVECPMGCRITVLLEDNKVIGVEGNTCARGKMYAENEVFDPKRVVTSTVKLSCGGVLPVKTDRPVSKKDMFSVMKVINGACCKAPVKTGDVIIENVFGANIISAKTVE
ncbi:MAG: DUF1667 domain-containing protein [Clostridia bacterium]|nr:DUF1667 domain-containing protein [Clostridia bacterium]